MRMQFRVHRHRPLLLLHFSVDTSSCSQLFSIRIGATAHCQRSPMAKCISCVCLWIAPSIQSVRHEHRKVKIVCDFIAASTRALFLFAYLLLSTCFCCCCCCFCSGSRYVTKRTCLVRVPIPPEWNGTTTSGASGVARCWYKKQSILI